MTSLLPSKWNRTISQGNYNLENKFGFSGDIDNIAHEDIWTFGDGNLVYLDQAEILNLVSSNAQDTATNGNGARTVTLIGLDADWKLQTEVISLNGETQVPTTKSFIRLYRMFVDTVGLIGWNAGEITAVSVTTLKAQAQIPATFGQTQMTHYTVPVGKEAYIVDWHATCGRGEDIEFRLMTREPGKSWRARRTMLLYQTAWSVNIGVSLGEKTDVRVQAKTVSGANRPGASSYELIVADIVN